MRCKTLFLSLLLTLVVASATAGNAIRISEEGRRAVSPEIAVARDGSINLIWVDKGLTADRPAPKKRKPGEHSHRSSTDLYFSRSTDAGRSWSEPVRVNDQPGAVWGFAVSKPRIAVSDAGTVHVFFPANEVSSATGLDVVTAQYTRSTDGGKSFEPARTVNTLPDANRMELLGEGLSASFSFGTLGISPDGTVVAAWQDIIEMEDQGSGADVHVAVSTDDGETWTEERVAIATNAVCPCCQLTMTFNGPEMLLGYRKIYADGRDSTVARARNAASPISAEARLPFAAWDIDGCPLKPTEMAVDGDWVFAAAYTAGEAEPGVYFSRSSNRGASFEGSFRVHPGAAYSDAPEMTVAPDGRIRLVWQAKVDGPRRLFTAESLDHGGVFSAPLELPTPAGNSFWPATAAGPDGTTYVTWQQDNEEVFLLALPIEAAASNMPE
jgi:hypothetical protein